MSLKLYYSDLNEKAQAEYLKHMGYASPQDGNLDVFPIAIIETPEPELTTLKLYSPITIGILEEQDYYEYGNDEDAAYTLNGFSITAYKAVIAEALESENDSEMEQRGLMAYYHGPSSVDEKVVYAYPTVEEYRGELLCMTKCRIKEPLTKEELAALKDYLSGQYSDGFGEGLEQREQKLSDGGLMYIHLWQGDGKFDIQTEHELKGAPDVVRATDKPKPKRHREAR